MDHLPPARPQKVNRGGVLAADEVVGRDGFIQTMWATLKKQGVVLTAERRMGKTSVLKRMREYPPPGTQVVYRSFENLRTRSEFVEALLTDLKSLIPKRAIAKERLLAALDGLDVALEQGPVHIKTPKPAGGWKRVVERIFEAADSSDQRIVFFWDEFPVFIGAPRGGGEAGGGA